MFHEYPKSLYLTDAEGEHRIVQDAEEEKAWREKGYRMLNESQEESAPAEAPKRRGRPPKEAA